MECTGRTTHAYRTSPALQLPARSNRSTFLDKLKKNPLFRVMYSYLDHICLFVHHNDGCCSKTSLLCHQVVKVHQNVVTNLFVSVVKHEIAIFSRNYRFRDKGSGAATRNHTEQVVPASDDVATVDLYQLFEGDAHLLLHGAGVVHVARDVKKLRARVASSTHTSKPITAPPVGKDMQIFPCVYC